VSLKKTLGKAFVGGYKISAGEGLQERIFWKTLHLQGV
jgi:hypothetical protein